MTWTHLAKDCISVNHEEIMADLKEKVMNYPLGCESGKKDFLKYLGFDFPLTGRFYGGTLTVTIEVENDDWVDVDNIRAAIGNVLIGDCTRTVDNESRNPQFKIETTSERNYA